MKKTNLVLSVCASLLLIAGCSSSEKDLLFGGKQDPLADKDHSVQSGGEKPTAPEGPKPIQSDAIRIDTVNFYSFQAGVADEFKISHRVLIDGYTGNLEILNLADFTGATYDKTTGVFSWTPPTDFVAGGNLYADLMLNIRVTATKANSVVLTSTQDVSIRVNRLLATPDIISAQGNTNSIREGEKTFITIEVADPGATNDTATWPVLNFTPTGSSNVAGSLVPFLNEYSKTRMANGHLQYTIELDLGSAELTKTQGTFGMDIQAVSKFNTISTKKTFTIPVANNLADPVLTWNQAVDAAAGHTLEYQFLVFDPKNEGKVDSVSFSNVPTGMTTACKDVNLYTKSCQVKWAVPASQPTGIVKVTATATMKNNYYYDTQTRVKSYFLEINVTKPASPAPEGAL